MRVGQCIISSGIMIWGHSESAIKFKLFMKYDTPYWLHGLVVILASHKMDCKNNVYLPSPTLCPPQIRLLIKVISVTLLFSKTNKI